MIVATSRIIILSVITIFDQLIAGIHVPFLSVWTVETCLLIFFSVDLSIKILSLTKIKFSLSTTIFEIE